MSSEQQARQQQPKQRSGNQSDSAARKRKNRKAGVLFAMVIAMMVIYFAQVTGLDAMIPKIIGTVGYWFDKDWETPVRISLGTAEHLLFIVAGCAGLYLSKQEEA